MNRQLRDETRRDAILTAAFREHHTDRCPDCDSRDNSIAGTVYGYEVICNQCGATVAEADLTDEEPASVYY